MKTLLMAILVLGGCTSEGPDGPEDPRDGDGDGTSDADDCAPDDAQLSQEDEDGDGVSSCDGDCDDDDPLRFPGNAEVWDDAVDHDCDGWIGTPGRWEEALNPDGSEVHGDALIEGVEVEPPAEWDANVAQPLGVLPPAGETGELLGRLESIEQDSWHGDNDAYSFITLDAGQLEMQLDWEAGDTDLDFKLYCEFEDARNPAAVYPIPLLSEQGLTGGGVSGRKPEFGRTIVELAPAATCWTVVMGFRGSPTDYVLSIGTAE
jgi:hypothetical protein